MLKHLLYTDWWATPFFFNAVLARTYWGRVKKQLSLLDRQISYDCLADWQVDSFRMALNMLPHDMLLFGSDVFWPCDRQRYLEEFVSPQFAILNHSHARGVAGPGSHERVLLQRAVFHGNALKHWQITTMGWQQKLQYKKITPGSFHSEQRRTEAA
jgi:hypothetical protein